MTTKQRIDAICLSCGTVRTVAADRLTYDGEPAQERFYACTTCGTRTLHGSALRVPDARERANHRAILRTDPWAVVEAFGWAVVDVPNLPSSICLVGDVRVVLVRAGIDTASTEWCIRYVLDRIGRHNTP